MTWHDGARILEAGIALDTAFHQVAQNTRKPIYQAEHQCLRNGHGHPGNECEQAPEPVSYTHLDVYKRQAHGRAITAADNYLKQASAEELAVLG